MIERKDADGIRTLRLAHGKVSAMDFELGEAFIEEMDAARDPSVKAVVLTGSGSSFSAGVDLFRLIKDGPEYGRRFLPVLDKLLLAALTLPKPMIAAVNGHAIAGGCILAATCDHRIMTEGSGRIGIPELAVGVPFPALPLQIMAARVADGPLRDLVFSGRTVLVDEARTMGLVDDKCPAGMLMDRALEAAQRMAAIPAGAFALAKESFVTPILERTRQLAGTNARAIDAWLQPHTYDTIRTYLERTIRK
jgi:enoyl-CoA hydratase